jgi:hypothetical protein
MAAGDVLEDEAGVLLLAAAGRAQNPGMAGVGRGAQTEPLRTLPYA